MSDSFSAAYERAKNVRNGLLAQEGIAEDAFDEEGQRISNMLLGQTTQFYMQQEMLKVNRY